MTKKLKHKTLLMIPSVLITAVTTTVAVYVGARIGVNAPGSLLELVVPVGASTVQQVLVTAWTEFSNHLIQTCTSSTSQL